MSYDDSLDLSMQTGSRLLSEESLTMPGSPLNSGADDLSLSELSLDRTVFQSQPFNFIERTVDETDNVEDESTPAEAEQLELDPENEEEHKERLERDSARKKDEKLRSDLFILKKLNTVFSQYNEALDETGSANERIAAQLNQTEALLNKYVRILSRTEEFAKLIFDEQWNGGLEDEEIIAREEAEAIEQARREEEERARAAEREQERRKKEQQEKLEREERERKEREKQEKLASRGGIRGVRGTRASMRAMRGNPSTRGQTSSRPGSSAQISRPPSSAGRGIPRPSGIPRR